MYLNLLAQITVVRSRESGSSLERILGVRPSGEAIEDCYVVVDEPLRDADGIEVATHDHAEVIGAAQRGVDAGARRIVEAGEGSAVVEEAVGVVGGVDVEANDDAAVRDAGYDGRDSAKGRRESDGVKVPAAML